MPLFVYIVEDEIIPQKKAKGGMIMVIKREKCFSLLLVIILCFTFGGVVQATDANLQTTVSPNWTNTSSVNTNLSFNGGLGTCGAYVIGKSGTTQITGTVVLSRKNSNGTYTAIKTWSGLNCGDAVGSWNKTLSPSVTCP